MLTSMDVLAGAAVLDLYAGSGALGIEALSRGAARVTFVDHDRAAVAAIRANLESLAPALGGVADVVCSDAQRYASHAPRADLVLVDPPYRFDGWTGLLAELADRTDLVIAESGAEWDPGPGWETVKVKRYGGTLVTVVQPETLVRQEGET